MKDQAMGNGLKIVRRLISIVVLSLSVHGLFTGKFDLLPLMMLFLAVLMFIIGVEEFQKNQKSYRGYVFLVVSLLGFLVSIQGVMY
ncbi:DUF3953 domain-containing protein [Rossellomorea sp. NPDC071047]|uniref:DUF3953 domain-containing protein n=1 Tax=Rossellomorea sp. NPDC071047 TaxID=3390675 RepID=UPI003D02C5A9